MSSDPRENPKDAHETVSESSASDTDDSTNALEARLRSLRAELSGHAEELVTPSGEELSTSSDLGMAPFDSPRPGDLLFNKYRVEELLGRGGMGEVWLVRHNILGYQFALKLIVSGAVIDAETMKRFVLEAQVMRAFSRHPHAVVVHDADIDADRHVIYIVMDVVHGCSIAERLKPGVQMPLDWTTQVLGQLCDVLHQAHELGIVHRELSPAKLMLEGPPDGPVHLRVLDFGIAKILDPDSGVFKSAPLTESGQLFGRRSYASPEQLNGARVDPRSDLYSIGVILYEFLTGYRPFQGTATKLLYDHTFAKPPRFAEANPEARLPAEVERVVMRCLEKKPDDRLQSARELYAAFRKAVGESEPPLRADEDALTSSALHPRDTSEPKGLFKGLLGWLGRSMKKAVPGGASASRPGLGTKPRERESLLPARGVPSTIRRRADVSFPTQVLVGKPYHLSVQLVTVEDDSTGGLTHGRTRPYGDDWTMNFLVPFFSSPAQPGALAHRVKVGVSLAAENFEIDGAGRAEMVVPLEGDSPAVQFSLRGKAVGPGRVMIDLDQGGRPAGSVDLTPEVVTRVDLKSPSSSPAPAGGAMINPFHDAVRKFLPSNSREPPGGGLILNLATGPFPTPPDLVIKVFEHRLAGHPGRLQFVLSSTHRALSDLPVLDGDMGTLDLRAEIVDWVGAQLRAIGTLAEQPDATTEWAERILAHIGYNLFQQLVPPALQDLCWTFRQRGAKTVMVLSDEPHIPWELIKPYRYNPRTGEFEEDEFWGQSYALTHWLRGRPPAQRLSFNRICAMATGVDGPQGGKAETARNMVPHAFAPTSIAAQSLQGSPVRLMSIDEELEVLRSLEVSGSRVRFLPARRREIMGLLEQGEFDLLHLIAHGEFCGRPSSDASALLVEDGAFLVAELSPRMAPALRRAAPLIFFNSCHSGRIGFSLTRLGSWGAQFVQLGCGGFVGTLWPVTDRAALAFAQAFYGWMCQGLPIGESMVRARERVRERYPNDPTWLAYCCFADPMAQVEPTAMDSVQKPCTSRDHVP
jgi:serine/threonine protein kinase